MPDKYFLSATGTDLAGVARRRRVLWSGRCAVAEYAFEQPHSLPRWTLPEQAEVTVTEDRVIYRDTATGATGELRWPWPQHLRVQPGSRDTGPAATVTQVQLVCAGPADTFPALIFAGGDIATVRDADRLANVLRQAIARYRVEHAVELGVSEPHVRMLSRLAIGPEFTNYQGGEGQTVSLLGARTVEPPAAADTTPAYGTPVYGTPAYGYDPGAAAYVSDYRPPAGYHHNNGAHAYAAGPVDTPPGYDTYDTRGEVPDGPGWPMAGHPQFGATPPQTLRPGFGPQTSEPPARPADEATLRGTPDLEARAAELAARVASLVSTGADLERYQQTANLSGYLQTTPAPPPAADRAEKIRRTAARLAANSARNRTVSPRRSPEDDLAHPYRSDPIR